MSADKSSDVDISSVFHGRKYLDSEAFPYSGGGGSGGERFLTGSGGTEPTGDKS